MKKQLLVFFLAMGALFMLSIGALPDKSEIVIIKTKIYCSHCKECESCGGKIQRDLSFDKGIQRVELDEKQMTITVQFNSKKTNAEEIRKRISMYGYDADNIKADSLAVTKLDGCCLKK